MNIIYHKECTISSLTDNMMIPSNILSKEIKDRILEHRNTIPDYVNIGYNGYYTFITIGSDRLDIENKR